jgi:hypothetical protein
VSVSMLSAAIPSLASRSTVNPVPVTSLSRADVMLYEVAEGLVKGCGWHGMQGSGVQVPSAPPPRNRRSTAMSRPASARLLLP